MTSVLGGRDAVIAGLPVGKGERGGSGGRKGGRETGREGGGRGERRVIKVYALTENEHAKQYARTVNQVVAGMN